MIDYLAIARAALARAQGAEDKEGLRANERNERNAKSPPPSPQVGPARPTIPSVAAPEPSQYTSPLGWQRANAARLTADDLRAGRDAGGYCAEHRRALSWPEQDRGACSWCVAVDPEREPEYWASHWRRFIER